MNSRYPALYLLIIIITIAAGCTQQAGPLTELKHYPVDSVDSIITKSGIALDTEKSTDGNGSLRVDAQGATVVRLFEINDIDVDNARLLYQARLRTEGVVGQVYIEMWCVFADEGEFFSRSIQSPLSGTTDWVTVETPFFLQEGQDPDLVKLNLVVDGKGTAWIDDVRLLKGPL